MHRFQALLEGTNYKDAYWDIKERLQVQSGDETDRHTSHLGRRHWEPLPAWGCLPLPWDFDRTHPYCIRGNWPRPVNGVS